MSTDTAVTASSVMLSSTPAVTPADGRRRMSTGGHPFAGGCVLAHQEKTGSAVGFTASNAQTTDLRGIPPRGSAPV